MPTKTKPRRDLTGRDLELLASAYLLPADEAKIAAILGIAGNSLKQAMVNIREAIHTGISQISTRNREPLPAHHLAGLLPALRSARAFAKDLRNVTNEIRLRLEVNDVLAPLELWIQAAERQEERLRLIKQPYQISLERGDPTAPGGSDGGTRKRNMRRARGGMLLELAAIYRKNAVNPTEAGERAFLKIIDALTRRKPSKQAMEMLFDDLQRG
jgi:hypothetical protein